MDGDWQTICHVTILNALQVWRMHFFNCWDGCTRIFLQKITDIAHRNEYHLRLVSIQHAGCIEWHIFSSVTTVNALAIKITQEVVPYSYLCDNSLCLLYYINFILHLIDSSMLNIIEEDSILYLCGFSVSRTTDGVFVCRGCLLLRCRTEDRCPLYKYHFNLICVCHT